MKRFLALLLILAGLLIFSLWESGCAHSLLTPEQAIGCVLAQTSALSSDLEAYRLCDQATKSKTVDAGLTCAEATVKAGEAHVKQVPACMPPPAPPAASTAPPAASTAPPAP